VKRKGKKLTGFAAMSKKKRAAAGRKGGENAQAGGRAHQFTPDEAREARAKRTRREKRVKNVRRAA
jgi:general stress protein YciG